MSFFISIGSTQLVTISSLVDSLNDGTAITDATASAELTLATDSTSLDTIVFSYDEGEERYEGTIASSVTETLTENRLYKIRATVTSGGATWFSELECRAKTKKFT